MNSAKLVLFIITFAICAVACNQPGDVTTNQSQPSSSPAMAAPTATPDALAFARANFMKHCAVCHGETAEGGRVEVEGKKLKVPSLKARHAVEHPDERLVKQITEGDDEMPAFKDKLSAQEIKDLVRFVRKEFQGK
jgi:mono/diheme cytochrome c family protein